MVLSSFYIFGSTTTLPDAQIANNPTEIDRLFDTAETLYKQKKYDEAIRYYDKILALNSIEIDALNDKGVVLGELQKYDEALPYFDQFYLLMHQMFMQ